MPTANILCIGTTPAAQRTMVFRKLTLDAVNRAATTIDGVAGKSVNVAKVLKVLGEEPIATGFLGGDRGQHIRSVLAERRVEAEFVTVQAETRQCITVIDESTGAHTELVEEGRPIGAAAVEALLAVVRRRVAGCRAVVMSGTLAAGVPPDLYLTGTRLAEAEGALSVVDAQGAALTEALKAGPGLVKPNRAELAATAGRPLATEAEVMQAMRELCERGAHRVVITAGERPALAFDGESFWRVVSPRVRAASPIGSGDAFTAGLVWRLLRGDDLGEACRWAAAAGAANALTLMSGELDRADVDRLVGGAEASRI
jgi:tagatose 6-phosphate kinase